MQIVFRPAVRLSVGVGAVLSAIRTIPSSVTCAGEGHGHPRKRRPRRGREGKGYMYYILNFLKQPDEWNIDRIKIDKTYLPEFLFLALFEPRPA